MAVKDLKKDKIVENTEGVKKRDLVSEKNIYIKGARSNNLKNVDLVI